ncbi:MAG: hypothetical protein DI556_22245 [Rhodovulum sulfidophilum]|uniref:Fumarylacetoacetase-like C-terminal domain-containing protein n=1 Tax=Rhodovulum sulfidophilum TaxID=35806 RepID=A0A2W5Q2Z6_RHOSU|nr:MAG: hypothetical protein DI556_22245 [Rhodovulum sulfidophilum]
MDLAPGDIDSAYAVQEATVARLGGEGAWKTSVGREEDVCSPIPADCVFASGHRFDAGLWRGPRLEVEVGVVLRSDLGAGPRPWTAESVLPAIGDLVPVLEIATSRFIDRMAVSPLTVIADLQNNEAIVQGAGVPFSEVELAAFSAVLEIDGEVRPEASPRRQHSSREVVVSLAGLANHAIARGRPLRAGVLVILGARLMPVPIRPGTHAVATIEAVGRVEAMF